MNGHLAASAKSEQNSLSQIVWVEASDRWLQVWERDKKQFENMVGKNKTAYPISWPENTPHPMSARMLETLRMDVIDTEALADKKFVIDPSLLVCHFPGMNKEVMEAIDALELPLGDVRESKLQTHLATVCKDLCLQPEMVKERFGVMRKFTETYKHSRKDLVRLCLVVLVENMKNGWRRAVRTVIHYAPYFKYYTDADLHGAVLALEDNKKLTFQLNELTRACAEARSNLDSATTQLEELQNSIHSWPADLHAKVEALLKLCGPSTYASLSLSGATTHGMRTVAENRFARAPQQHPSIVPLDDAQDAKESKARPGKPKLDSKLVETIATAASASVNSTASKKRKAEDTKKKKNTNEFEEALKKEAAAAAIDQSSQNHANVVAAVAETTGDPVAMISAAPFKLDPSST